MATIPTHSPSSPTLPQNPSHNALAGCGAGILAKTIVAPIERVKLLLQLQTSTVSSTSTTKPYKNAFDAAARVYKEQGLQSFWRGNLPNLYRHTGATALTFALKDNFRQIFLPLTHSLGKKYQWRKRKLFLASFLSGGAAGGMSCLLFYPLEFARTRLALDMGSGGGRSYPNGMRDVFSHTMKSDGLGGLYKGFGIAIFGVVIFRALHLGGYDFAKAELLGSGDVVYLQTRKTGGDDVKTLQQRQLRAQQLQQQQTQQPIASIWKRFCVAELVSLVSGTLVYPIDTIRRRLMMQSGKAKIDIQFTNTIECIHYIRKNEGFKGFFKGVGPNMVRSVGGAVLLVSYDEIKQVLGRRR